jgi:hypothetical protein
VPAFIRAFFAANPLSQLGLVAARKGICERLTELSGMPEAHVTALAAALRVGSGGGSGGSASGPVFGGDFSLQNALDLAVLSLSPIPPYGTREVLVLQSALATCDPGNIHKSLADAKAARLRVSVVGLSAEARPAVHPRCLLPHSLKPPPAADARGAQADGGDGGCLRGCALRSTPRRAHHGARAAPAGPGAPHRC